jgi:hypothetical protein
MTEYYQGRVLDVTENTIGTEVTADHAIGASLLSVYDSQEFSDDGGALSIEGVVYGYTTKDDDAGTIKLTSTLSAAVTADTEVFLYPLAVEKEAMVQIDEEEPVMAAVPHNLVGVMDALIRDGNDQESVIVAKQDDEYEIHDLLAQTYTLYGQYINTSGMTIPPPVPTTPPAVSPAFRVTGFTTSLVVETDDVQAGTIIQYHISTTSGFTPSPSTLFTETEATVATIDRLPDGDALDAAQQYFLKMVAYNIVGTAAPSAEVSGALNLDVIDELITSRLVASFIQTGKISVGQFTLDAVGMKVNRPGGGYVFNFPFNGTDNLEITAAVTAVSLNVLNSLSIQGAGSLYGSLTAANGIIAPTSQAGVGRTWPYVTTADGDGSSDISQIYQGLVQHPTNSAWLVQAFSFFGAGIRYLDKTTGSWQGDLDLTGKTWPTRFYPQGGITYLSSNYYIIGSDSTRNGDYYLYKIDSTTGTKNGEAFLGDLTTFQNAVPRLFTDGTNIMYAWVNASKNLRITVFNTSLVNTGAAANLLTGVASRYNIGDVHFGNHDGIGSNRVWIAYRSSSQVLCFNPVTPSSPSTWTRDATYDYDRASTVIGMTYDTSTNQMVSIDSTGLMYKYGKYPINKSIIGKYAWYDGNATAGTHETQPGPSKTYTLPARSYLTLQAVEPPDFQNTDPLNTDKANQVAFYATDDGGSTWRRLVYTADPWGGTYPTLVGLTTGTPKVTNEFLTSTVQTPGVFKSTAQTETIDGMVNDIYLEGSGRGRLGRYTHVRHMGSRTRAIANTLAVATSTEVNLAPGSAREVASGVTWDATNNQFVINKPGIYIVEAQIPWPSNATGRRETRIRKNGLIYNTQTVLPGVTGAPVSTTSTCLIPCDAGDTLTVFAWQNSGATLTITPSSDQYYFSVCWVAP